MRRVDHLVCALAEIDKHSALLVDGWLHASWRIDRVAMAGLAIPTKQYVVRGIKEQEVGAWTRAIKGLELLLGVGKEQAASRIDHERDLVLASLTRDLDGRRHQRGW